MTAPQSITKANAAARMAWAIANTIFMIAPNSQDHRDAVQAAIDAERAIVRIRRAKNSAIPGIA